MVGLTIWFWPLAPVWAAAGAALQTALEGGSIEEIFLATARSAAYSGVAVPVSALAFTAFQMGASAIGGAATRGRASLSVSVGTGISSEDLVLRVGAADLASEAMDAGRPDEWLEDNALLQPPEHKDIKYRVA